MSTKACLLRSFIFKQVILKSLVHENLVHNGITWGHPEKFMVLAAPEKNKSESFGWDQEFQRASQPGDQSLLCLHIHGSLMSAAWVEGLKQT